MANALMTAMKPKKRTSESPINLNPAHKGSLHTALGVAQGSPIPASKLSAAVNSPNKKLKAKAVFAKNAKSWGK